MILLKKPPVDPGGFFISCMCRNRALTSNRKQTQAVNRQG